MELYKWNYNTHKYDKVVLPEGNYKTYSSNMEEIVNCPQCLKELPYGETFTSHEFHTPLGFGYGVCQECSDKEWERRIKAKQENE